jgi:peptidoglycan hydrolase-like protein with peptidoglycan-binding domain
MYDGINTDAQIIARLIKPGDIVAYYIDGEFAWNKQEIALFPYNEHVTITVLGNPADAADCETGDMTPRSSADWVFRQKAAGYFRPTIYRSLSVMQDVRNATGSLVMGKDWDSWVADYDNEQRSVYPNSAAKQYRSTDGYDMSAVFDDQWPHRVAVHSPAPITAPKWPSGLVLKLGNKGYAVQALQKACAGSGIRGVRGIASDGIFGQQTETAVRNFEAEARLTVDTGIAGSQVRNALIHIGALNSAGQATD